MNVDPAAGYTLFAGEEMCRAYDPEPLAVDVGTGDDWHEAKS